MLDEPVDGLDPVMRRQIWSIIMMDVAETVNTTVLVSSHNLRELEDVCDHVGIMSNGKILLERSLVELQENICKIQIAFDADTPQWPAQLNASPRIPSWKNHYISSNSGKRQSYFCNQTVRAA